MRWQGWSSSPGLWDLRAQAPGPDETLWVEVTEEGLWPPLEGHRADGAAPGDCSPHTSLGPSQSPELGSGPRPRLGCRGVWALGPNAGRGCGVRVWGPPMALCWPWVQAGASACPVSDLHEGGLGLPMHCLHVRATRQVPALCSHGHLPSLWSCLLQAGLCCPHEDWRSGFCSWKASFPGECGRAGRALRWRRGHASLASHPKV